MARLSREERKKNTEKALPGFEVVDQTPANTDAARSRGATPDGISPDLEQARETYFRDDERPDRGQPAGDDDGPKDKNEDSMVTVRPKGAGADRSGAGDKQFITDRTGKPTAAQG